jgi:uncharacterized membrane protein
MTTSNLHRSLSVLLLLTTLGAGVVCGVFFAFSSFIMSGLSRIAPSQGIAAMQSINVTVIGSAFLMTLFVTGLAAIALGIGGVATWDRPGSFALLLGAAFYVVGVIGVTGVFNVPLNEALRAVDPTTSEAMTLWSTYLSRWTIYNHVRTLASFATTITFGLAFVRRFMT